MYQEDTRFGGGSLGCGETTAFPRLIGSWSMTSITVASLSSDRNERMTLDVSPESGEEPCDGRGTFPRPLNRPGSSATDADVSNNPTLVL